MLKCAGLSLAMAMFAAMNWEPACAQALDSVDLSVSAPQGAAAAGDDDEDRFFSHGGRTGFANGSIASAGAVPPSAARPMVDVVATCRAVLADEQSYYDRRFIAGCRRAVTQSR